ncbi:hypothetical protein GTV32_16670 [Gordonia sp. SID5947]|uniref:hypothetical protein n=1 Tax=Gordonia sp. SID5947 TaxID=2690315 RepID=UPI00136F62B6|nr:hypothetical protein [Gordonia sp. SID5947]MYR07833.1 hypothetical protein [Gordonia sp. SID5947]
MRNRNDTCGSTSDASDPLYGGDSHILTDGNETTTTRPTDDETHDDEGIPMTKKRKLIGRLETEVERLKQELARVDKEAKKRLKKAEQDATALRAEVLKLIGQGKSAGSGGAAAKPAVAAPKPLKPSADADPTPATVPGLPDAKAAPKPAATSTPKPAASAKSQSKTPAKKTPVKKTSGSKASGSRASGAPTVAQLRSEAKDKGIKGYSTMTKAQLLKALG